MIFFALGFHTHTCDEMLNSLWSHHTSPHHITDINKLSIVLCIKDIKDWRIFFKSNFIFLKKIY